MVISNYRWLNSASQVLISTCSAPLVQTGEHKQFSQFDLDIQPQASQKSRSKVKRFKQESAHRQTDGHTHGRYQTYYRPCYAVDNNTKYQEKLTVNVGVEFVAQSLLLLF